MSLTHGLNTELLAAFKNPNLNASLRGILRGIEKESLRISPTGDLAQTSHPQALGAALTHPEITTDYSEALLEFITAPHAEVSSLLEQLDDIHRFTYEQLSKNGGGQGSERLWPASMPCKLGVDSEIPVARYGDSHSGKMKTIYRLGLGHRYGRAMQTIAGIHYNFSFPDNFWRALQSQTDNKDSLQSFKVDGYFNLIRNFRRNFWLLIYLFGASPALCSSFVKSKAHKLLTFPTNDSTLYLPYATSLRMGDLGYQSNAQESLVVNYNNLDNYLATLCSGITRNHPAYEKIGVKDAQGNYQQLNTALLQIENEFYSSIRPKCVSGRGETALQALRLRGVEYIEVRCVDLNPYEPLGITAEQIHLMDSFLLYCLLSESPPSSPTKFIEDRENQNRIVNFGRDPALELLRDGQQINMRGWALEILDEMKDCASLLDQANESSAFSEAIKPQVEKIADAELTPSARVLRDLREQNQSYFSYTLTLAEQHTRYFSERPLDVNQSEGFKQRAIISLAAQHELEKNQQTSFEDYLANYYAQYRNCSCDA